MSGEDAESNQSMISCGLTMMYHRVDLPLCKINNYDHNTASLSISFLFYNQI